MGQGRYDVSVVSHAGHSPGHYKATTSCQTRESFEEPSSHGTTDWYCLEDQIMHKLAFIEEEGKARDSIFLIGHFIGCWMIFQRMDTAKITKVFLLFPTIEKMGVTPNGQLMLSYLWSSLRKPFTGLVWLSSRLIPNVVSVECPLSHHSQTSPAAHHTGSDEPALTRRACTTSYKCESNIDHAFVECSSDEMLNMSIQNCLLFYSILIELQGYIVAQGVKVWAEHCYSCNYLPRVHFCLA